MTIVAGAVAILGIDPEVTRRRRVRGVIVSAVFLGALPVTAFYTVGYLCRPWLLLVPVLAALAVGTFFYLFFGLLLVARPRLLPARRPRVPARVHSGSSARRAVARCGAPRVPA